MNDVDPINQILPESLDDINSVNFSENRFRSKVWMDFTPVYVEGRIQGADCVHCHKRFSAEGRSHLNRHTQTCSARVGSVQSRVKDELSPALTDRKSTRLNSSHPV